VRRGERIRAWAPRLHACILKVAFALVLVRVVAGPAFAQTGGVGTSPPGPSAIQPPSLLNENQLPPRTPPLLELGDSFLKTGKVSEGFEIPTGAIWNPSLIVYGSYRTAVDAFGNHRDPATSEWANRLDLLANLQLSGTERVFVGLQPLNHDNAYTGCTMSPRSLTGCNFEGSVDVKTAFFEGVIGELFPGLGRDLDTGFAVGHQPIEAQDDILINDTIDSLGLVQNSIHLPGLVNTRITGIGSWGNIHRGNNQIDPDARLLGLLTETDTTKSTINLDAIYVASSNTSGRFPRSYGSGFYLGVSSAQQLFGRYSTTFRVNVSRAMGQSNDGVANGALLVGQISFPPSATENVLYLDTFWAIDQFTSAARGPTVGGPLETIGILFSSPILGRYGTALSDQAKQVAGGALGYQMFFNNAFTQLVFEVGGRASTIAADRNEVAAGLRFQQRLNYRTLVQVDGYVANYSDRRGAGAGARTELQVSF
jgi:hypothetical protein